jgi:hypothetical protein
MNNMLSQYARLQLKDGLSRCTEPQQVLFKRMYCHEHLDWSIEKCVDNMPEDSLDWAMQQVQNTLRKSSLEVIK